MTKFTTISKIDRPREKFLKKGADALSKSDLLAILLGSGIKGRNVKELSDYIIKKFDKNFLTLTVKELVKISGIGEAKALQIVSAISLVKRFYDQDNVDTVLIKNYQDVLPYTYDIRDKKKEYLICLYLNARNSLLHKETVSVGLLDKSLIHPREIYSKAIELNAASIILVHNHPSGIVKPSEKDIEVVRKISQAGDILGILMLDFIIISQDSNYSFYKNLNKNNNDFDYVSDGLQGIQSSLFQNDQSNEILSEKSQETYFYIPQIKKDHIQLQNRRYIGSKHKLIEWIFSIINSECKNSNSFGDIFAGTGIVAAIASRHFKEVILNDFLYSNHAIYQAFFSNEKWDSSRINDIIKDFNNINGEELDDNYFSLSFGGKYFSKNSSKKIGFIRENIEANKLNLTSKEYFMLITSLLYSIDKIANTVGHYDAYFKKENIKDGLFMKPIDPILVNKVSIYRKDTNQLAKEIYADIMYIDSPYNSRQYSRFYHVLETLTKWDKPKLYGTALKPPPENISDYSKVEAKNRLAELVKDLKAKYLVVSYNNTYESKSHSSQNKIALEEIRDILVRKGETKIFEKDHKFFNAGNTDFKNHKEFLFVTKVNNE